MKSNPVIKIEYSGKEPASNRANYKKLDRIVDPGFPVDPMGYWNPANVGKIVQVPTEDGHITMRGVDQPLWGMDEYGNTQYQMPGQDYHYPGKFITEYPIAKKGGQVNWLDEMQDGGGIDMSKVRMDFYPKSQIEAQEQLDYQTRSELAWQKQQEENKKKSIAEGVKKGIPKKQAEAIALSQENPRDQGEIKENIPQSTLSKAIEIASNPITAMEDYVRSGYNTLPDHFSSNPDRDMLSPTSIANMGYQFLTPMGRISWAAQSADNADDAVKAGDYTGAAIDAAFALLGLGEGKKFAQTVNKLNRVKNINNIRKAKNAFTFNPEVLKAQQQSLQEAKTLKGLQSFKPNIKGKFEGVGFADDVKQLSSKPTYENNPYTFRDPQSNQPIYQTDPADFQNFKNSEMINEAKTHYKNASNKWLNTEGVKRSGHTDVPEFNDELKYIKDQAQYGKRSLETKIGKTNVQKNLVRSEDMEFIGNDIPNVTYGQWLEHDLMPNKTIPYTGKYAFQQLTPNKFGGESDDEEFRRGGQKGLKKFTSKNIATSVNDIMMRNVTLFGPAGKKRYKPGLKFKNGGGWLDNIV